MSNQPEHNNQQSETLTTEEVRQALLAELEASKRTIDELSDHQLEAIIGAGGCVSCMSTTYILPDVTKEYYQNQRDKGKSRWQALGATVRNGLPLAHDIDQTGDIRSYETPEEAVRRVMMSPQFRHR